MWETSLLLCDAFHTSPFLCFALCAFLLLTLPLQCSTWQEANKFSAKSLKKPLYLVSTKWQTHTVIIAGEHRYSLQEVEETKNGAKTG